MQPQSIVLSDLFSFHRFQYPLNKCQFFDGCNYSLSSARNSSFPKALPELTVCQDRGMKKNTNVLIPSSCNEHLNQQGMCCTVGLECIQPTLKVHPLNQQPCLISIHMDRSGNLPWFEYRRIIYIHLSHGIKLLFKFLSCTGQSFINLTLASSSTWEEEHQLRKFFQQTALQMVP